MTCFSGHSPICVELLSNEKHESRVQRCRFTHRLPLLHCSFIPLAPSFIHWPRRTQKMQNIPLSLSSLTSRTSSLPRSPITKLTQLSHLLSSSATYNFHAFSDVSCRKASYPPSSLHITARNPASFLISSRKNGAFKNFAALVPDAKSDEPSKPSALIPTLQLGAMFGIWYLLNIYFNIYNKQVLKVYPFPATVTAFQFGYTTLMITLIWTFNLYPKPKISGSQLAAILPLAVAHTVGNLLTNISIGKVAVSFTHTIKALEPLFTVVLSSLFLGEQPTLWVVSSLVPIVGGVALASITEVTFNWIGFSSAMLSNLINQSRNVLSKKLMVNEEEALDNINLYSVISIISFILSLPFVISMEGFKFTPSYLQSAASQGLNVRELCVKALLSGFCFHAYQQVSYGILEKVSAVTHSVGNCVKRVVVIVSSVIFFRTPLSPANTLGTAVALGGVFLYSRMKRIKPKPA